MSSRALRAGSLSSGQGLDRRAPEARGRFVADLSRRLFRSAPQSADADHARERVADDAGVGVSDRTERRDQIDADRRQRHALRQRARQLWAIDARTARQVWQYRYPDNTGFHIGHRGVAVYKDSVYLTTPDAHLVALDARNGKVKWNVEIADAKKGYWSTNAPLLIRNHLLVGVSGDFDNLPGILTSVDPETGKTQWVYYSTPPPGTPGSTSGGATGGQMWMTGTYDPAARSACTSAPAIRRRC